jgi:hypothetical protein
VSATNAPRWRPSGPIADDDSETALGAAIDELIRARAPGCHADAGAVLDALASLSAEIAAVLPDVVADARDQGYTWQEIAALLGRPKRAVKRGYAAHAKRWRPPLDLD